MRLLKPIAPDLTAGMYRPLTSVISILLFFTVLLSSEPSKANGLSCNNLFRPSYFLSNNISTEDRTLAVHLTNYFPKDGFVRASIENRGRFAPTLHFALGQPVIDHAFGKWSQKQYGVLLPLGAMRDQILNLFPQDTFVLGDVKLPPEATIFVPNGERIPPGLPFQIRHYNAEMGIKNTIEEYIRSSGTLVFKAPPPFSPEHLIVNGKEVPGEEAFRSLFRDFFSKNKEVTSTSHDYTPWGKIDYGIIDLLGRWLRDSSPLELKSNRVILDTLSIQDSLLEVHRIYRRMKLPEAAQKSFTGHLKNLRDYLNLLQVDVALRKEFGKSILATDLKLDPTFKSKITLNLSHKATLRKILIDNFDRLATVDQHEVSFTPRDLFSMLNFSGLDQLQKTIREEFPNPISKEKSEIDLVIIWRASQLLCQNKISADVALSHWRERIGNVSETSIKINVIDNMTKILFKNGIEGVSKDIIRFFNDPLIRRIFDHELYYSHYQNNSEALAVLDKILQK